MTTNNTLEAINERLEELCGLMRGQQQTELLSVRETAQLLGVSTANVYDMTHMDGFPSLRVGRRLKLKRRLLLEWLDRLEGEQMSMEVAGHSNV